jgi:hypothetical protein
MASLTMSPDQLSSTISRLYHSSIGRSREDRQCVPSSGLAALRCAIPAPLSSRCRPRARPPTRPPSLSRAEIDVYAPNALPSIASIRANNTAAVNISRSPGGPLIVEYVRTARGSGPRGRIGQNAHIFYLPPHSLPHAAVAAEDGESKEGERIDAPWQVPQRRRLLFFVVIVARPTTLSQFPIIRSNSRGESSTTETLGGGQWAE